MPIYSPSKLNTYENCPRRYAFRYIEKPPIEEFEGIEAFMGLRVHETLEGLYKYVKLSKIPPLDKLIGYYNDLWGKNFHENVRIVKKDITAENYRITGEKAIIEYYDQYKPFDDGKSIGLEYRINFKLSEYEGHAVQGFIDRLVYKGNGIYEIHDYKSSGTCPTQEQIDSDRQLALYQIGIQKIFPDAKDVELVWHYLIFGKEFRSRRDEKALEELAESTRRMISIIEGDREFKTRTSALCEWCEYKNTCPAWTHIVKTEEMTPQEFSEDDGVKMVDALGSIDDRIKSLKAERENIEGQLIAFALKNDAGRIIGLSHIAKIIKSVEVLFPRAGEPDRKPLEVMIKQSGLWEEFSQLSISKLKSGFISKKWDAVFLSKLQKFATEVVKARLKIMKKRDSE